MPKFSANLSMLFQELPFLDRFQAASDAGFTAVEFMSPYDEPVEILQRHLSRNRLDLALFNLPSGDWAKGERGIAVLPHRQGEFRAGVEKAITYARGLGCPRVNCLAGIAGPTAVSEASARCIADNLAYACDRFAQHGLILLVEAVNSRDVPGFFIDRTSRAVTLLDRLARANLRLQFDVYHSVSMGEDPMQLLREHIERIGHVQVADSPGRHEPGTGTVDFDLLFKGLDALGYRGWIGAEYRPIGSTLGGLDWLGRWSDTENNNVKGQAWQS